MRVNNAVTLGLDIGIGSIGWIMLERMADGTVMPLTKVLKSGEVISAAGVRLVNVPEGHKTKELLSKHRQMVRRQRITIRRKRQRMREVRRLLAEHLNIDMQDTKALHHAPGAQKSPWELRSEALERCLTPQEFGRVLIHMAKHRGFLSNSKKNKADSSENGKMLKAVNALQQRLKEAPGQTFGALMAREPAQRNRSGIDGKPVYTFTPLRAELIRETHVIFNKQNALGNSAATGELEDAYINCAFSQRPLQSVAGLIGNCAFLADEKRAPLYSVTAERFRFLQRLGSIRLVLPDGSLRSLTVQERHSALGLLAEQKSITYATLRKRLQIDPAILFDGLRYGVDQDGKERSPEKSDVVGKSRGCAPAHAAFKNTLGAELAASLYAQYTPEGLHLLDAISKIISDNDDTKVIQQELCALNLPQAVISALMEAVQHGLFADFRGTMALSLKAMEAIFPHMLACGDYAKACELAGFNHTDTIRADWRAIRNPLVQHMVREVRRQVDAVVREFNVIPGRVHIETARDLGKSVEERARITRDKNNKRKENDRLRLELAEHFNCPQDQVSATELLRYKLWRQQGGKCCYYMLWRHAGGQKAYAAQEGGISVMQLRDGTHETQIDHILPYSRTFDSSFHNLGLCLNAANQNKGNRSPFEWIGTDNPQAWHDHETWVNGCAFSGPKKRNFLLRDLNARQDAFVQRNLNDTRYICRVIMDWFDNDFYAAHGVPPERDDAGREKRRVYARPGMLTAFLRKCWGLEHIKKDAEGNRAGDRHHLLDAFIVACSTETMLHRVTDAYQKQEEQSLAIRLEPPAPSCRHLLEALLAGVLPSRAERGKTTGPLHEDTLRSIVKERNDAGETITNLYSRVPIMELAKPEDVEKIKDARRCPDIIRPLRAWLEAGKPKNHLPVSDVTGFPIKKVTKLYKAFTSGVELRRGEGVAQAKNGEMVRVDVFQKAGQYYLVPVYAWQARQGVLPNKAVVGKKLEAEWLDMDETYAFCFSLFRNNYVLVEKKNGILAGYYAGTDRDSASITLERAEDHTVKIKSIGVKTLKALRKFRVDRLGRLHEVHREKRVEP